MARTWIFQANPKQFDVDGFLAAPPDNGLWRVKRFGAEIEVGDIVYLWRAIGQGERNLAGIFAEAEITEPATPRADKSDFRRFWLDRSDVVSIEPRAAIRIMRFARMSIADIANDPIVGALHILRAPVGTNFNTSEVEADRLRRLWNKLGTDWSRNDEIEALKAYHAGTAAPDLSRKIDRTVSDVRKKLASFTSFDPRSPLYSASIPPTALWNEFLNKEIKSLS
jgi:hypothetical protein